jgi:phosphate transport system protein
MTEIRKQFHDELDDLVRQVVELGRMANFAIDRGTLAFVGGDLQAAEEVIAGDRAIDDLTQSIELKAFDLVARQQPTAIDLRVLVTIMREIREIERAGDNMVNIVKATRRMHPSELADEPRDIVMRMRSQAMLQLNEAVSAFAERDLAKAAALPDMDDVMDDLQKMLFRWLFDEGARSETVQHSVQLALVGRYFERIADHAVNLAERVPFMVSGGSHL